MEIQPLTPRQIEQFIECFYRDVPERQQFQRELQRRRELRELARVPALLGFILQLWRKRGSVTDDKLELYARITLELAQQLDREKEGIAPEREWLVEDKDGSLKLDLLRQLAFNQLFKGLIHPPYEVGGNTNDVDRLVFTGEQLRAEAAAFARTLKEREGLIINPRNLAEDVKATAMLRQVGSDHYAFAHLTLQEYLAAWQLAKRDNGDTCERIFCRAYFNPTLAEMEVLPMTLGLVDESDRFYEALEQLPESLDFKGLRLRARGLGYLVRIGHPHLTKLSNWLIEFITQHCIDGFGYRETVLRAFSSIIGEGAKIITKRVIALLRDNRESVRESAASTLGQIGNPLAVSALQKALSDVSGDVRGSAASALGKIGDQETVASLINVLRDDDHFVQDHAVEALKLIGNEQAMAAVSKREAENISDEQDDDVEETYDEEDCDKDSFCEDPQEEIDEEQAIQELVSGLGANDIIVREISAETLVESWGKKAVPALVALLEDIDVSFDVRRLAAETLGEIGGKPALKALINALNDCDIDVRIGAIEGLGQIR
ncbi:MAG: HEAT repeat domain-containing protein, partial [Acidobacteriota bacterium]|nr:HEAT repeat domain-containing protein [Acidobacteriota bacterium]